MKKNIKKLAALLAVTMLPQINIVFADDYARFDAIESELPQIKKLLDECSQKGIPTDLETVDYTVIKKFVEYGRTDLNNDYAERAAYVANKLELMADNVTDSLNGYLNGTKEPIYYDKYQTSDIVKNGASLEATIKDGKTGAISEGEVFLNGYMGYNELRDDIEILDDLGTNIMGLELGVTDIIKAPGTGIYGGWGINKDYAANTTGITVEEGIGQNSTKGLHIVNNGGTITMSKGIVVKPNTTYEIGCVSKNSGGSGVVISAGGSSFSANNPSTRFATSKTTFTTGTATNISITITSSAVGDNIIDNMFVREKGTTKNILINNGFETDAVEKNGLLIDAGGADTIVSYLNQAAENNLAVDLLLSPHYFPVFVLNENSSYNHGGSGFGGGGVEWYKDRIKEVMKEYIDALIPMVKDSPALMSICLSNEPMFNLMYSEESFAKPMWRTWLKEKYSTISNLNKKHGTYYSSFSYVPMVTSISQTQAFYDWKEFNEEMFADWHAGMADQIRSIAPDLKVHAKMVFYLSRYDSSYEYKFMLTGTDANMFSDFSDLHGNDAHAYLESGHMYQMQSKLEWYDYLKTIEDKPIINSEDHIIMDMSKDYTDKQAMHVAADLWQGALHGRSASTSWVYARTYDTNSLLMDSLLHRPDVMSEIGKTNLKINKVADEVAALRDVDAEVGVLFSPASRVYNRNYMNCLYKAYESLLYSGYKTSILDDKAMAAGKWNGMKVIIVPDTQYVSADMLNGLKAYKEAGGKIICLGSKSLLYDDYKKSNTSSTVSTILDGATRFETSYSGQQLTSPGEEQIMSAVRSIVPNNVKIINSATGEELSKTDYRCIDYNGMKLINICRYVWEDVNAEIQIDGKPVKQMYNPVTEENVSNLKISGYTPVMLMLDTTELQPPENAKAVWNDGAYEVSWSVPENSNAAKIIVSVVKNGVTVIEEELSGDETEYVYKSQPEADIEFIINSVSAIGGVSENVYADLQQGFNTAVSFDGEDIALKGVEDDGKYVAFTVIPDGGDAANVNDLSAMGIAEKCKDNSFTSKIILNNKASDNNNFVVYAGNENEKQTHYISYIKDSGVFEDVFVTYNYNGYDIFWNLNRNDVVSMVVSDGTNSTTVSPAEGFVFSETPNVNKTYTLTAKFTDGTEESAEIAAPVPLGINCRVVDGVAYVSGAAQAGDSVQVNVIGEEGIIFAGAVQADDWGRFEKNLVIDDSKIPPNEEFTLQIITKSGLNKTTEFIYTGSLPVHIGSENDGVSFTSYSSKKIEKSQIIVAFYNGDKLADCKTYDVTFNPGEKIVPDIETYTGQGYKVKIYLWNGIDTMTPLSRVYVK